MLFKQFFVLMVIGNLYMKATGQITLTETGINNLQLGMNIQDANNLKPFVTCKDRHLFDAFPTEKGFYYLDTPLDNADPLNIKYIFICTGNDNTIKRFTLLVDDSNNNAFHVLHELLGQYDVKGEGTFGDDYFTWTTNAGASVYLFKGPINSVVGYPVSEIHIQYPNTFEDFGDYSIDFKIPFH